MNLYLFDFDGTMTSKDSLFEFIRASTNPLQYYSGILANSPKMLGMKLKLQHAQRTKEDLLKYYFLNWKKEELDALGVDFTKSVLPKIIRKNAFHYLKKVQDREDHVYIVSASLDIWLHPFTEQEGIKLICTRAGYENNRYTKHFATPNCNGPEKARRIRAEINLNNYDRIIAFGDSKGDAEMFELAHETHFKPFREK